MPAPTNSAQLRLNRLPPVAPPVTERNTRNSSCVPDIEMGNVWLARVRVPPVETRLAVVRIGPVIESWWTSIAASGDPAVRPFPPSATRNVIESMLVRSNGGSSGSVTVTEYGIVSPNANVAPLSGVLTTTVGLVLPEVMIVDVDVLSPEESNTLSTAVNCPRCVYVCVGLGSVEIGDPSPKSHSKRIESPGSSSSEPALEKLTVSGDGPSVRSVLRTAFGGRVPLTYSHLYMPASGLITLNPL